MLGFGSAEYMQVSDTYDDEYADHKPQHRNYNVPYNSFKLKNDDFHAFDPIIPTTSVQPQQKDNTGTKGEPYDILSKCIF